MKVSIVVAATAAALLFARGAEAQEAETKPAETAPKKTTKKKTTKKKTTTKKKAEPVAPSPEAKPAETPGMPKSGTPPETKTVEEKPAEPSSAPASEAKPAEKAAEAAPSETKPADAPPDAPPTAPATGTPAAPDASKQAAPTAPPSDAPAAAATPAAPAADAGHGEDNDAPSLSHTAVTHAPRGKSLRIEAQATDASGVFQVVLYLRRQGGADFIPLKMIPEKNAPTTYATEIPTALISTNLEYYIETYDTLGNGPSRAGTPERPLGIKLDEPVVIKKPPEEEKKIIIQQQQKPPPAITHSAVGKVLKGKAVEVQAKIRGTAGVSKPAVKFRQLGDSEWKTLPMGNIGQMYTATIPGSQTSRDIEYYLEAYDSSGVSAGNSASADAPFLIRVEDEPPPAPKPPLVVQGPPVKRGPPPPPPFKPNPGKAAGYFALAAALGTLAFAGGEAYGSWQANENYQHTFKYEGRNDPNLLKRANEYGSRAKTFAIIGGASAVVATVLLIVFSDSDPTPPAGSGGDAGPVLFRF